MKSKFFSALSAAIMLTFTFVACETKASGVTLNKTALMLNVGSAETLIATVYPEKAANKDIAWSSSNTDVATVGDDGIVKALLPGKATITVTAQDGGKTASCLLTVVIPVSSIALDKTELTLRIGNEAMLVATVKPDNATNKALTWTSSDTSVAYVTPDGTVEALDAGTATITVASPNGGQAASCILAVSPRDVYVAGFERNAQRKEVATLWKNGKPQHLTDGENDARATSVFVSDFDVWVVGHENFGNPMFGNYVARLWKNGVLQPRREDEGSVRSVFVSGSDVYFAGSMEGAPVVWKNGIPQRLGKNGSAISVFVSGNDVYVIGRDNRLGHTQWKNGVPQRSGGGFKALFVYGADVYIAVDGILAGLGPMLRINDTHYSLSNKDSMGEPESVFVSGGDTYVAGFDKGAPTLWVNGDAQRLGSNGSGNSVYVSGKTVYVAGHERFPGPKTVATLWVNGRAQRLGSDNNYSVSEAHSVFVK